MGKKVKKSELGRLFGRPDIERCDLFIDCGQLDWGTYTGKPIILNESSKKGRQILGSGPDGGRTKCGLQGNSGYFDPKFKTIAVNEPYIEKWKLAQRPPAHPRKGAWIPSGPAKVHSTPGDNYGTFTKIKAFSPLTRPVKNKKKSLINFFTNPGKKGNSGYSNICLNKYPPHVVRGRVDFYLAPGKLYSKNWKVHKGKIRDGPFESGFFPRPYFEPNPYKGETEGPTYVQPKADMNVKPEVVFHRPAPPKSPGNNHDGCFDKFTEWVTEPYMTQWQAEKLLDGPKRPNLIFRPEPRLKTYYTVSIVNNKIDISCNEVTWRTIKPITYPQFNL